MKRMICLFLMLVLCISTCSCRGENSHLYKIKGNYIYFGSFPTSLKADNVSISYDADSNGYYLGSDNEYYVKQTVKLADQNELSAYVNNGIIFNNRTYYFKVEKIKWKIISKQNDIALLHCDNIIFANAFKSSTGNTPFSNNNYENSDIRKWLTTDFYNSAFTKEEKEIIKRTAVDNSYESSPISASQFCCNDTNDNVFLLSYKDVLNKAYDFSSNTYADDSRIKKATDYAIACGASVNYDSFDTEGTWMLRSQSDTKYTIISIDREGTIQKNKLSSSEALGIVPAIQIYL